MTRAGVSRRHPRRVNHPDRVSRFTPGEATVPGTRIDAIKPYNPTVIQTNLTKDREEELGKALRS
jgi:hypothetical protein